MCINGVAKHLKKKKSNPIDHQMFFYLIIVPVDQKLSYTFWIMSWANCSFVPFCGTIWTWKPAWFQHCVLFMVPSRSSLRSAASNHLLIPPVRRSTVGARAFTVPMEQFAVWHYVYRQSASLSSSSKKLFIPSVISRRCSITILFYRGLEAFYIALGHVNLIRNYYYYYYEVYY